MKFTLVKKFLLLIIMSALSAGLIFFACGFLGRLPRGIVINGIDVGGKTRAEATAQVREEIVNSLKNKSLTVHGKEKDYVFTYPEIGYKDNLQKLTKTVKRGDNVTAEVSYYLNGISEISAYICADESTPVEEPYAQFNMSGEPFTYFDGNDGVKADRLKLLSDIRSSLEGEFCDVYISLTDIPRNQNLDEIKYNTRKLSSFTTYFDGENLSRSHNIRLASEMINGTILQNGEGFSFNDTVGERTAERGFLSAKIIENGEFVEGVGGGVCQVSTTLFNAVLLAGCEITEFHPHSLAVSYVPPSFDAMVSGNYYDLKFENLTGYTLYIRATAGENYVKFDVYGRGDGANYGFMSVVKQNIPAPEETTSDITCVKDGKDGIISEGYLTVTRNGIQKTVLFRRDKYAPVKKVVLETEKEDGQTQDIKTPEEEKTQEEGDN